uniref:Uncharacterized protein n=1 Tax=Ditylenchus dipsaci TaxID=166011 RepID=A0A915DUI4_9BILA
MFACSSTISIEEKNIRAYKTGSNGLLLHPESLERQQQKNSRILENNTSVHLRPINHNNHSDVLPADAFKAKKSWDRQEM